MAVQWSISSAGTSLLPCYKASVRFEAILHAEYGPYRPFKFDHHINHLIITSRILTRVPFYILDSLFSPIRQYSTPSPAPAPLTALHPPHFTRNCHSWLVPYRACGTNHWRIDIYVPVHNTMPFSLDMTGLLTSGDGCEALLAWNPWIN